jgi:hypothetical protein
MATEEDEGVTRDTLNNFTSRVDKRGDQGSRGVTPFKKRAKLSVTSPVLDADYDLTMRELEVDLGNTPEDMFRTLLTEWRVLVSNVSTLKEIVASCRQVNREIGAAAMLEFKEVDFEVARLSNLIGTRSNDMDPVTVFWLIRDVTAEVAELTIQVNDLRAQAGGARSADSRSAATADFVTNVTQGGLQAKDLRESVAFTKGFKATGGEAEVLCQEMGAEVMTSFQPVVDLSAKLSSDKAAPGDLLNRELTDMRTEISAVKRMVQGGSAAALASVQSLHASTPGDMGVAWTLGSMSLGQTTVGSSGAPQATAGNTGSNAQLTVMVRALESRLQDIEDQLQAQTVSMAGQVFKSQTLTRSWLAANAPAAGGYIFFLDAHSMLSLASEEADTARPVLSFSHSAAKGGFASSEEAQVSASFKIALPGIFGTDLGGTKMSADSKTLPGMKVFEIWDPDDGYTGAKRKLEEAIRKVKATMLESVSDHLTGLGRLVHHNDVWMLVQVGRLDDSAIQEPSGARRDKRRVLEADLPLR